MFDIIDEDLQNHTAYIIMIKIRINIPTKQKKIMNLLKTLFSFLVIDLLKNYNST